MGPHTPSAGLGPSIPRAQGPLALLLLPRNLILKMVVLGLLCYQWLSRRVVCSTEEVSTDALGPCHPDCPLPRERGPKPRLQSWHWQAAEAGVWQQGVC